MTYEHVSVPFGTNNPVSRLSSVGFKVNEVGVVNNRDQCSWELHDHSVNAVPCFSAEHIKFTTLRLVPRDFRLLGSIFLPPGRVLWSSRCIHVLALLAFGPWAAPALFPIFGILSSVHSSRESPFLVQWKRTFFFLRKMEAYVVCDAREGSLACPHRWYLSLSLHFLQHFGARFKEYTWMVDGSQPKPLHMIASCFHLQQLAYASRIMLPSISSSSVYRYITLV